MSTLPEAVQPVSTPAAQWRTKGEADPHGSRYDGERASLTLGQMSDDELANGVFIHGDQPLDIRRALSRDPEYHPSITWLTAAKDRIRWLSRALVRAEEAVDAAHARIRELEQQLATPRGTDAQIMKERELTCAAIQGAIAHGYTGTNPPPSDDHWLAPYWNIGRERADHERQNLQKSDRQKLQHMLGATPGDNRRSQWGYRNYYAVTGGPGLAAMERMQTLGLVKLYRIDGDMKFYSATEAGCRALGFDAKQIKRALED